MGGLQTHAGRSLKKLVWLIARESERERRGGGGGGGGGGGAGSLEWQAGSISRGVAIGATDLAIDLCTRTDLDTPHGMLRC